MSRRTGALAVVAGAATWGTTGTSQALAALDAPVAVGSARLVAGAVALAAVAGVVSRRRAATAIADSSARRTRRPLLIAAAALAAYHVLFFAGVERAGVAVGTVVGIGSVPVFAGLLGRLADGDALRPRWWLATGLAIVGCALVLAPQGRPRVVEPVGVVLALGAGVAYAVLTVAARRVLDAGVPPVRTMARVFLLAALPGAAILVVDGPGPLLSVRGAVLVAWLAVVTVAVGYVLYGYGLRDLPPATVGTLTLTEPLVAAMLGVAVVGERPGPVAAIGAAALVAGLVLVGTQRPVPSADGTGSAVGDPPSQR